MHSYHTFDEDEKDSVCLSPAESGGLEPEDDVAPDGNNEPPTAPSAEPSAPVLGQESVPAQFGDGIPNVEPAPPSSPPPSPTTPSPPKSSAAQQANDFVGAVPVENVTVIDANGIADVSRPAGNDGDTIPGASANAAPEEGNDLSLIHI